jgi:hypothetical protein
MRNLFEVIEQVQAVIPTACDGIHHDLNSILDSLRYCPPENIGMWWQQTQNALFIEIGDVPTEDWHFEALSIWSTIPVDQIREDVRKIKESGQ